MRKPLELYAVLGPLLLGPASLALWWREYGSWGPTLLAWGVPVVWGYLVPGVGTNLLKVWEFDTRSRLGRFRPQHGFVFGSATAMLAWCVHRAAATPADCARQALVVACVLGFVNLLYEVVALRSGVLQVYNEPWAAGHPPEAVALDYAPWFFGGFGAAYGLGIAVAESCQPASYATAFAAVLAATVAVPVAGYVLQSRRRYGHWGTTPRC